MTELDQACRAFLRFQRAQGHRPKTSTNYDGFLSQWFAWLRQPGHSGQIADRRDWLAASREAGNREKTILTKAIHVKAFTAWLADEGEYLAQDPCAKVKRPQAPLLAKPTLSLDQITTLIHACNLQTTTGRRDRAMLLLLFSTGLSLPDRCAPNLHGGPLGPQRAGPP
jgi:site-specific recombinase XerD